MWLISKGLWVFGGGGMGRHGDRLRPFTGGKRPAGARSPCCWSAGRAKKRTMPSYPSTSTTPAVPASARSVVAMRAPGPWGPGAGGWALRVEGQRVSIVLQRAPMGIGAMVRELVIRLPHVALPFDFRDGVQCFQHHRGHAPAAHPS